MISLPNSQHSPKHPRAFHGGEFWRDMPSHVFDLERISGPIINADSLDAWYPPAPGVIEALGKHIELWTRTSPPVDAYPVTQKIAAVRNIPEQYLCCGSGSSQLIFLCLQSLASSHDIVMLLDPMYGEYRHVAEKIAGSAVVPFLLKSAEQFRIPVSELIITLNAIKPKVFVMVNPNNPAGTVLHRADMRMLLAAAPPETTVIIDETYIEYAGEEETCESLVAQYPNLVIIKSMSKIFALSGMRVGYLVAQESIAHLITQCIPPWSVSLPAHIAACAALDSPGYYREKRVETHALRTHLESALRTIPSLSLFPSVGSFILCKIIDPRHAVSRIVEELKKEGIYLRNCQSMSSQFHDDYVRITVRDHASNMRIADALKKQLLT